MGIKKRKKRKEIKNEKMEWKMRIGGNKKTFKELVVTFQKEEYSLVQDDRTNMTKKFNMTEKFTWTNITH